MTSFNVTIIEAKGGYTPSGYTSTGYDTAGTLSVESISGQLGANRSLSQTLTLTEAISLNVGRTISQTITNINLLARKLAAIREISQGSGGYVSSGYTVSGYITENLIGISDVSTKVRNVPKIISEGQVTLTDTAARIYAALRSINPIITVTESLSRRYDAVRSATETWVTTNSVTRTLVALRNITQTVALTELLTTFKGIAGTGARRLKESTAFLLKRSGITSIFKRSGTTST